MKLYFNEFNVLIKDAPYLPIVSGLLHSYALTHDVIRDNYEFMPYLFYRDTLQNIVTRYDNPGVAAFSTSMWNEQLNLAVAREVKERWPHSLIVFGGPQVPHFPEEYFQEHPFIDIAVRSEGEESFSDILIRYLESHTFEGIPGIAWRNEDNKCVRNNEERDQSKDLDIYPSPYLEGLFEYITDDKKYPGFQAIMETNRGCPFPCFFCFWGQGGLSRKYRFHSIDRVRQEIEWCAKHKVQYIFNADSNFGMHRRDMEIAQALVDIKEEYGYPDKFRTCFGKNTDDKIYNVAKLMHDHGLEKGITLARQSNDDQVLENIARKNIKMSTYRNLQKRFNDDGIPVYVELILGLPGETYDTWVNGIEDLLKSGLKGQVFIYLCQIYPNTEMADPAYLKKYGMETRDLVLTEIHGSIRQQNLVPEVERIVVSTDSMPPPIWRKAVRFSWTMQVLQSMKAAFFLNVYMVDRYGVKYTDFLDYMGNVDPNETPVWGNILLHFEKQIDNILEGEGRGQILPEYGDMYWDEEEAAFLRITENVYVFSLELTMYSKRFLGDKGIEYNSEEIDGICLFQAMLLPEIHNVPETSEFGYNIPEYFEKRFGDSPVELKKETQIMTIHPDDVGNDKAKFAREGILWKRRNDMILNKYTWKKHVQ